MNGEEFEELRIEGDLVVSGIFVDAVEKIGLLVVVGGEDDIVDDSLQDLCMLANVNCQGLLSLRNAVLRDPPPQPQCPELVYNACKHQGIYHRAGQE